MSTRKACAPLYLQNDQPAEQEHSRTKNHHVIDDVSDDKGGEKEAWGATKGQYFEVRNDACLFLVLFVVQWPSFSLNFQFNSLTQSKRNWKFRFYLLQESPIIPCIFGYFLSVRLDYIFYPLPSSSEISCRRWLILLKEISLCLWW